MTHDEMIAIIAAHKDGKVIEWATKNELPLKWTPKPKALSFNFGTFDYRIKPEPRAIYVNEMASGNLESCNYMLEQVAKDQARRDGLITRKFIEVTEEVQP